MDGKKYLSQFRENGLTQVTSGYVGEGAAYEMAASHDLARKLVLLYVDGGSRPEVQNPAYIDALGLSLSSLESYGTLRARQRQEFAVGDAARRSQGLMLIADRPPMSSRSEDVSISDVDLEELLKNTLEMGALIRNELVVYSDKLLADSIVLTGYEIERHGAVSERFSANLLVQAIHNARNELIRVGRQWHAPMSIERTHALNEKGGRGIQVGFKVISPSTHTHVASPYLQQAPSYEQYVHTICAANTELDTLVALQEWVLERKLLFLPIFAPLSIEQGGMRQRGQRNFHADVLLCSIAPGDNQIIPIQVKNRAGRMTRQDYDDNVVIVSNDNLCSADIDYPTVETPDGRKHTGHRVRNHYGRIFDRFIHVRGGRGHKPSRQTMAAYRTSLEMAFQHFDTEILPRILPYGSTQPLGSTEPGLDQ